MSLKPCRFPKVTEAVLTDFCKLARLLHFAQYMQDDSTGPVVQPWLSPVSYTTSEQQQLRRVAGEPIHIGRLHDRSLCLYHQDGLSLEYVIRIVASNSCKGPRT